MADCDKNPPTDTTPRPLSVGRPVLLRFELGVNPVAIERLVAEPGARVVLDTLDVVVVRRRDAAPSPAPPCRRPRGQPRCERFHHRAFHLPCGHPVAVERADVLLAEFVDEHLRLEGVKRLPVVLALRARQEGLIADHVNSMRGGPYDDSTGSCWGSSAPVRTAVPGTGRESVPSRRSPGRSTPVRCWRSRTSGHRPGLESRTPSGCLRCRVRPP